MRAVNEMARTDQAVEREVPEPIDPVPDARWPQTIEEFERLVELYQHRLVWHAFRRLGDAGEAEDVAQEVFLRAWRERERLRRVIRPASYLFRMTANLCTDRLRRRGRILTISSDTLLERLADPAAPAARQLEALEGLRQTEALLAGLPERQAEVIRLHVLDELSLAEIAQMLRRPLATIKSRLRYGLIKLRTQRSRGGRS